MWLRRLQKAMTEKAKVKKGLGDLSVGKVLQQLSAAPPDEFGANPGTARDQLLLQTLEDAWRDIQQLEGPNSQNWSWGKMHTVRFRHSLDQGSGNTQLLDLGPLARPGDGFTVNSTAFPEASFEQESGASYREILDTSDWDGSMAINTPGQSGQPGSSHYSDLLPLWDKGQYFPLLYSSQAIERETKDRLLLNAH
jgi:penicillin G amidase